VPRRPNRTATGIGVATLGLAGMGIGLNEPSVDLPGDLAVAMAAAGGVVGIGGLAIAAHRPAAERLKYRRRRLVREGQAIAKGLDGVTRDEYERDWRERAQRYANDLRDCGLIDEADARRPARVATDAELARLRKRVGEWAGIAGA
jgi:hypothetical protein